MKFTEIELDAALRITGAVIGGDGMVQAVSGLEVKALALGSLAIDCCDPKRALMAVILELEATPLTRTVNGLSERFEILMTWLSGAVAPGVLYCTSTNPGLMLL